MHVLNTMIKTFDITNAEQQQRFERIKDDLQRHWHNQRKRTSYQQLYHQLVSFLYQTYGLSTTGRKNQRCSFGATVIICSSVAAVRTVNWVNLW